jgi:hypothetical protein
MTGSGAGEGGSEFQNLLLPLEIVLLIVRRDTRISHGLSLRGVGVTEQFRASLGDIIAAMPARHMLSGQLSRSFRPAQRYNRHAKHVSRFANGNDPLHLVQNRTDHSDCTFTVLALTRTLTAPALLARSRKNGERERSSDAAAIQPELNQS